MVPGKEQLTVECPANLIRVVLCNNHVAIPDLAVDLKLFLTIFNGLLTHVYPRLSDVEP